MLTNLNWEKGLKVWNKIFKFFDNDADLKKHIKQGTEQTSAEMKGKTLSIIYFN